MELDKGMSINRFRYMLNEAEKNNEPHIHAHVYNKKYSFIINNIDKKSAKELREHIENAKYTLSDDSFLRDRYTDTRVVNPINNDGNDGSNLNNITNIWNKLDTSNVTNLPDIVESIRFIKDHKFPELSACVFSFKSEMDKNNAMVIVERRITSEEQRINELNLINKKRGLYQYNVAYSLNPNVPHCCCHLNYPHRAQDKWLFILNGNLINRDVELKKETERRAIDQSISLRDLERTKHNDSFLHIIERRKEEIIERDQRQNRFFDNASSSFDISSSQGSKNVFKQVPHLSQFGSTNTIPETSEIEPTIDDNNINNISGRLELSDDDDYGYSERKPPKFKRKESVDNIADGAPFGVETDTDDNVFMVINDDRKLNDNNDDMYDDTFGHNREVTIRERRFKYDILGDSMQDVNIFGPSKGLETLRPNGGIFSETEIDTDSDYNSDSAGILKIPTPKERRLKRFSSFTDNDDNNNNDNSNNNNNDNVFNPTNNKYNKYTFDDNDGSKLNTMESKNTLITPFGTNNDNNVFGTNNDNDNIYDNDGDVDDDDDPDYEPTLTNQVTIFSRRNLPRDSDSDEEIKDEDNINQNASNKFNETDHEIFIKTFGPNKSEIFDAETDSDSYTNNPFAPPKTDHNPFDNNKTHTRSKSILKTPKSSDNHNIPKTTKKVSFAIDMLQEINYENEQNNKIHTYPFSRHHIL